MENSAAVPNNAVPDILVVHISDLHVQYPDSIALARLEQLPEAIGQCMERPSHVLLLLTGDIAYSGKAEEYGLATTALESTIKRLQKWNPLSVRMYCCPGNHDCDFDLISPKVHESLLKDIGTDYEDIVSVVKELTVTQREFNLFRDVVCSETQFHNELLSSATIDYEGRSISICILNSSWSSKKREVPGALRMPAAGIPKVDTNSSLAIAMIHHPINWYSPEDVRSFSSWLDRNVDIALWGHEHEEDDVEQKRKSLGSSVRNFLANPIEDKTATCGFSITRLNGLEDTISRSTFTWQHNTLIHQESAARETAPKNPGRLLGQLRLSAGFQEFLDDPGGSFQHPRLTRNLRLTEILISPDLRPIDGETTSFDGANRTVSLKDALQDVLKEKRTVVFGPEQAGKTTAGKIVASEANRLGILPLYLDASNLKSINQSEITTWINSSLASQFEHDCIDTVRGKPPTDKYLIIDNFQQIPAGSDGISRVLERVHQLASRQLLLSSDSPATAALSADYESDGEPAYWTGAKCFELLPLGHKQRGELIRRWTSIGRDDVLSRDQIEAESRQTKTILDRALGKDSIPKYPIFILILLQHIEIGRDVHTAIANGSHGYLFEALITKSLDAHAKSHPINTTNDYLARFAKELWTQDIASLELEIFSEFHESFTRNNLVAVNRDLLLRDLERARVLQIDGRGVSFRYPYHFYYYLARWITSERSEESARAIDRLIEHIHTEKSANVLMFVAFREHESEVLERLIPLAQSLYKGIDIPTLETNSSLLLRFKTTEDRAILLVGKADAVSDEHNRRSDTVEQRASNSNATESEIRDSLNINTSLKTMQVLGQILRSRASAIPPETKIQVAAETMLLSRRMMAFLGNFVRDSSDQLVPLLTEAFEKALSLNRNDAIQQANQVIGLLVTGISKICFGRAASALASSELRPLLRAMEDRCRDRDELLIVLLARTASEVDYPENDINRFLQAIKPGDVLSLGLLRWAVSRRFYLDPPLHSVRDSACSDWALSRSNYQPNSRAFPEKSQDTEENKCEHLDSGEMSNRQLGFLRINLTHLEYPWSSAATCNTSPCSSCGAPETCRAHAGKAVIHERGLDRATATALTGQLPREPPPSECRKVETTRARCIPPWRFQLSSLLHTVEFLRRSPPTLLSRSLSEIHACHWHEEHIERSTAWFTLTSL